MNKDIIPIANSPVVLNVDERDSLRANKAGFASIDEAKAYELEKLHAFFSKHALGSKTMPSCFKCGCNDKEMGTRHTELPDIYLCIECSQPSVQPSVQPSDTPAAQLVPTGWRLVPITPTAEMLATIDMCMNDTIIDPQGFGRAVWVDMLEAAPQVVQPSAIDQPQDEVAAERDSAAKQHELGQEKPVKN